MSENNQAEFKGWARVEVMGHNTHIGFVCTQAFGAAVMFRIDQPAIPEAEETLVGPQYIDGTYAPPGSVVKRGAIEAATVLVGAGSIYRIVPCDEAAAMTAIRSTFRPPLMLVRLAEGKQIAAAGEPEGRDDDYDPDAMENAYLNQSDGDRG